MPKYLILTENAVSCRKFCESGGKTVNLTRLLTQLPICVVSVMTLKDPEEMVSEDLKNSINPG